MVALWATLSAGALHGSPLRQFGGSSFRERTNAEQNSRYLRRVRFAEDGAADGGAVGTGGRSEEGEKNTRT